MARFEQERIDDFTDALQAFLNGMISRQKEVSGLRLWWLAAFDQYWTQLISAWENYQQVLLKRGAVGEVVGT